MGRRLAVLHDGLLGPAPAYRFTFEAGALPSGVYLYRAVGETFTATGRMVLVREAVR